MRIIVIGAGAIGGWLAARLSLAGNDVAIRSRAVTEAVIAERGLSVDEAGGRQVARVGIAGDGDAPPDVLILAVKAPALAEAAEAARALIGRETLVVPMLNGVPWWFTPGQRLRSVDPDGRIAEALPLDRLVGCVVHASCRRTAPACVEVVHADKLILGEPAGGSSERVASLCALFVQSGVRAEPSEHIRRAIWYKLWGNATINPLSALTRSTADKLLRDPAIRAMMLEAMAELAAVGAAIGCPIGESGEDRMAVTARLGAFRTSMLQDVEAGRPIELEALLGAPIEIARRTGVPTPALDRLCSMTRLLAESLAL